MKKSRMKVMQVKADADPEVRELAKVVEVAVLEIISYYKQTITDKPDMAQVWTFFTNAVASFMRLVEEAGNYSGVSKKIVVLMAANDFYDYVIAPLDLPKVPSLVETRFIDPILKEFLLSLVSGLVDSLATVLNRTGWFDVGEGTNGASPPVMPTPPPGWPTDFVPY